MTRLLASCLLLLSLATGCAMCDNCNDYGYSTEGGKHPRINMNCGRVHSVYDPADGGEIVTQEAPAEEMKPMQPEQPPTTTTTTATRGRWRQ